LFEPSVEATNLRALCVAQFAAAFKPNAAFFEAFGAAGIEALHEVIAAIPRDTPVILDAKRGDISTTADAYARAAFEQAKAHGITVNPYMGWDAVEPFVRDNATGVFVLCHTSNPSAQELQLQSLAVG
jgi:uridine monophosphate synthetase